MTKLDLWNMALGCLGSRSIAGPDENSAEARACALYWDAARRTALRDFPWRFARRLAELAPAAMPAVYADQWSHAYALPPACLKLLDVRGYADTRTPFAPVDVDEGAATVRLVLTEGPAFTAEYIADIDNPALFDDDFALALARRLACLIAMPLLKGGAGLTRELGRLYRDAMPAAAAHDASEGRPAANRCADTWLPPAWRALA